MAKTLSLTANYLEIQDDAAIELTLVQAQVGRYANQASQEWRTIESFVRQLSLLIVFRYREPKKTVSMASRHSNRCFASGESVVTSFPRSARRNSFSASATRPLASAP